MRVQTQRYRRLQAALLSFSLLFSALPSWAVTTLDHIVAIVNDDVITDSELKDEIARIALQIQSRKQQLPPHATLRRQVMERLILTRLQLQKAKESGISVNESMLTDTVNNIAQQNKITIQQLRETLESDGVSFQAFREDIRQQITLRRLQQRDVINRIFVTDQELEREIKQSGKGANNRQEVQLQHILLGIKEGASEETITTTRAAAEQLIEQLKAGKDFTSLAIQHSDGRRALEGGDLGWYKPSQVPTLFVEALSSMRTGDISAPIHSASGFHIIKLAAEKGIERLVITQSKARHILINTNEVVSDHDARTRLVQLRERILGGDDFAALAQSHSDDKGSAINGGDLGWVNPGAMVPIFEQQMDEQVLGEISPPFRTQFGWHIVQVLDRRDYDSTDEVLKNNALIAVRRRKADEATDLWLRRLRDEAYIDLRLE
ncbi:MAG: peptidylprolyl isomerase [Candidatus Polarisedimenticolaceae bacterium]|nr:peptidylprolyl isomerase [Candidatus Polarisedimenticolaceae bacterium]